MIPLGVLAARRAVAAAGLTATYTDHDENGAGLSSYTFTALDLGSPTSSRRVTVAVAWRTAGVSNTVTGVTIAGQTATVHVTHVNDTGGNRTAITWATAHVPSGATGDVVVTFSGTIARCAVTTWHLSTAPTYVTGSATTTNGAAVNASGGAVDTVTLALAFASGNATNLATWTGATERHEAQVGVQSHSAADMSGVGTVTVSYSIGWVKSSLASSIELSA